MLKTIKSEMVKYPVVTDINMQIDESLQLMKECDIRHLPVMENSKLMGVVSERDLLKAKDHNYSLSEVVTKNPFIVGEEADLSAVVETMADYKYGSVLIVNSTNELIGIFTTIDALRLLVRFLDKDGAKAWSPDNVLTLKEIMNHG